jgi:hypothetical protein
MRVTKMRGLVIDHLMMKKMASKNLAGLWRANHVLARLGSLPFQIVLTP